MIVLWKVFSDAHRPENARRVYERVVKALDVDGHSVTIEPYTKTGGHTVSFRSQVESSNWPEAVIRVLEQAQRIGHQWTLSGSILEELDMSTNNTSFAGVTLVHCRVRRLPSEA
jgi:hypothetical protein